MVSTNGMIEHFAVNYNVTGLTGAKTFIASSFAVIATIQGGPIIVGKEHEYFSKFKIFTAISPRLWLFSA
jgi:hypothetical protein